MPENVALAKKTLEIRHAMNKSQEEFAAECGISVECLSLIERGMTNPKLSTMQKIAAYGNVTVSNLVDTTGGSI